MRERLLVRHFLSRLLDNDLLSPHADRLQTLSVLLAALVTCGVAVTIFLGLQFLFAPFQSPGQTAVVAIDARFLYIAWSMVVMALVATGAWDALSLDARDTAILGPLPVPKATIRRAKLQSVVILASLFLVALNAGPSVVFPLLMVGTLSVGVGHLVALMAAHFGTTVAAGVFGFLSVLIVRGFCSRLLGPVRFSRASALLQASLVVVLGATGLLLPALAQEVRSPWLAAPAWLTYTLPPLWFLGLQESLVGSLIAALPRAVYPPWIEAFEVEATAAYQSYGPVLKDLGREALVALGVAFGAAIVAYRWSFSQISTLPANRAGLRRWTRIWLPVAHRIVARTPSVRAGFFLTLRSLWRSLPHRLTLAVAVATGSAVLIVLMRMVPLHRQPDVSSAPVALFGVQVVLLGVLLIGFRHAIRLPISLRASWVFDLAWTGNTRAYVVGVQRAALIGLAIPVLTFVFPLYAWVLGVRIAMLHWTSGLLLFMLGLELVLLEVGRLPFVSTYVPDEHLKAVASLYVIGFAVVSYRIAWLERLAFDTPGRTVVYLAVLALLALAGKAFGSRQRRNARSWEIGAPEETVPATLGLSA